jgi:dienelactone hydrolase
VFPVNTLLAETISDVNPHIASEIPLHLPEDALLYRPTAGVGVGVLVLLGSSGRMDVERAQILARHGAHAMALRWFGGDHQSPGVCEIPIEVFVRALDRLAEEPVKKLAVIGLSKGAEAALLLACADDRIDLTIAMSPPSVVWANVGPGLDGRTHPYRSSWTWRGEPLPFVAYDDDWSPAEDDEPVAYRGLYEQSLLLDPDATEGAAIPVEQIRGDLVLAAGRDDQLWPSDVFVRKLATRRVYASQQVEVIFHDRAGHTPLFPGQPLQPESTHIKRGGTPDADAELGADIWTALIQRLGVNADPDLLSS